jgi:hypothetical protein
MSLERGWRGGSIVPLRKEEGFRKGWVGIGRAWSSWLPFLLILGPIWKQSPFSTP